MFFKALMLNFKTYFLLPISIFQLSLSPNILITYFHLEMESQKALLLNYALADFETEAAKTFLTGLTGLASNVGASKSSSSDD